MPTSEKEMRISYQEKFQTFQQHLERAPDQLSQMTPFYLSICSEKQSYWSQNGMKLKQMSFSIQ